MSSDRDALRRARAYLMRVAEPPAVALAAFVARHGAEQAAQLVSLGQVPAAVADETSARRHLACGKEQLARAAECGARLLIPEDEEWPRWPFLALRNAAGRGRRWATEPLGLWVRGTASLGALCQPAVAMVGARLATPYGQDVAGEFAYDLASRDVTIISGAAFGIDGAAHRGALAAGKPTVAVLGCGVDRCYPAGHDALLDQITRDGLVISEYAIDTPPARHRFLVRNRLIAALGEATVVVEAGRRSGASNTAATATALGRSVFAVPGPVTSAMSDGCHALLRNGMATVAASVEDILSAVRIGDHLTAGAAAETRATDQLEATALRVHEALSTRKSVDADQVAVESGVPLDRVRAILPELELTGFAIRSDEGWRRSRAS